MTPATLLASARSLIESNPAAVGLVDLCDLKGPTFVNGGASGDSVTIGTIASDIRCMYEATSPNTTVTVGGKTYSVTHRVLMLRTNASELITPEYRIPVHARDGKPEIIFENPVMLDESLSPLVTVLATLVKQGYQL
jgi:hypothetical protein